MRRIRALLLALALPAALVVAPAHAGAATWASQAEACGGFNTSERGSGQMDGAGRTYIPCSLNTAGQHANYIAVYNAAGARIGEIPLRFPGRAGTDRASDVAPSPDGSFLYVIHYAEYTAYRFNRQGDGSYVADPNWRLANYPDKNGGVARPLGQFLATDGNGDIYFSSGLWACNVGCTDDAIVKYGPAGNVITRFGQKSGGSWALGHAAGSFGGVAVTADGRRVFVADVNNSRIQRFDRLANGTYGAVLSMGMDQYTDPNRWGACGFDRAGALPQALAAPYDLAMSTRGELLVLNTTCFATAGFHDYMPYGTIEVRRFGQDGTVRGTIVSQARGDTRVHGIAVDFAGNIHMPQAKAILRPAAGWSDAGADAGGGGPLGGTAVADATAPVITALTAPATTKVAGITLDITATDAAGVTHVRIRDNGAQGGWMPYAASIAHTLAGYGRHVLEVEVRDPSGNVSAVRAVTVDFTAPAAPQQPAPTPTNPRPSQPGAVPTGPTVDGGGGAGGGDAADLPRPKITSAAIPVQVFSGRRIAVRLKASGASPVRLVRFSTTGRWSAWQRLRASNSLVLPRGIGWKGVLVQVRDTAGASSVPWFQPVLMGPRGTRWAKGTTAANRIRGGRGSDHIESSQFDEKVDVISCGAGWDTVYAQPEDRVARDCERVVRVKLPSW
jgi:hypothetical protein